MGAGSVASSWAPLPADPSGVAGLLKTIDATRKRHLAASHHRLRGRRRRHQRHLGRVAARTVGATRDFPTHVHHALAGTQQATALPAQQLDPHGKDLHRVAERRDGHVALRPLGARRTQTVTTDTDRYRPAQRDYRLLLGPTACRQTAAHKPPPTSQLRQQRGRGCRDHHLGEAWSSPPRPARAPSPKARPSPSPAS